MANDIYRRHLNRNPANYAPLTPVSFLARSALAFPDKVAIVHGDRRYTYAALRARCLRLASALVERGIGNGDTVAVMAPNIPAMIEAHFAIPMTGAVINCLNIRLDPSTIAFCLDHGEARMVIVDSAFLEVVDKALAELGRDIPVVVIRDLPAPADGRPDYEQLLADGDPDFVPVSLDDEWSAISLGYTSGTTGNPKGVVCHHRGAYLNALGNALVARLDSRSIYLWTLPMFHCNGWCYIWAVTAVAGTHICLRQVDAATIYGTILRQSVTHLCGAPVVLNMLANAPEAGGLKLPRQVEVLTGGAAPPSTVIAAMERVGFRVTHLYGLTESFGPALVCDWHAEWDALPLEERARLNARQGVNFVTLEAVAIGDPGSGEQRSPGSSELGEVLLRGNTVMMGYLKNERANEEAFAGGWFHTGDLAIRHPDGYVEVKDRSKDIIISGGENISSLEVEDVLYRHPAVLEAAVVARPDEIWGEHPCAFVALRANANVPNLVELTAFCRSNMAHFKVPRTFIFGPLPKTATGKIQKYVLREQARKLDAATE